MKFSVDFFFQSWIVLINIYKKMKRTVFYSIALLIIAVFVAVPDGKAQQSADSETVLTIGDSNGSFKWSWPAQLGKLLPSVEIINNSESGRTVGQTNLGRESLNGCLIIDGIMESVGKQIGDKSLDYIVICLGTNDAKVDFKESVSQFKSNMETFLSKIENSAVYKKNKPQIILVSPFPMNESHERFIVEKYEGGTDRIAGFCEDVESIAKEHGYKFVNVFKPMTQGMIDMGTSDGVHLLPELSAYVAGRIGAVMN